ncbi:MAG: TIGR01777 family oxidoreductase [Pirellulales bacterium]|nr:TIGR01777 family oxidoreductase [Pirellulales bacterium]
MPASTRKLVLPGGAGFLGRLLAPWLAERGWEVVVLSRRNETVPGAACTVFWDGANLGAWHRELDGAAAVVNLAGRSVNCRYHERNRREIMASRVRSTQVLGEAIAACQQPPTVWLNSSTATIYKHSFEWAMTEERGEIGGTPAAKDEFSVRVAQTWEQTFAAAPTPGTRKVALRLGMVLGLERGTVFQVLWRLTRLRLGGAMAGGRQYVSWIHEVDFCRAVEWLLAHEEIGGPVNVVAPSPIPNRAMMAEFRRACGVRVGLPAEQWMLEVGSFFLRTETELVIKSRRVVPKRLVDAGFEFRYPTLGPAIDELVARLRAGGDARDPTITFARQPAVAQAG